MSTTEPASGPQAQTPTCYRHPTRETYVRCTRCDRYICPDCMRDAAVGHQCVECVRQGSRTVRRARTVFGGQVSATPVVTYALIAINVASYVAEVIKPSIVDKFVGLGVGAVSSGGEYFVPHGGVIPPGFDAVGIAHGEWYRLITSAFLHAPPGSSFGITHILFNMWALWVLGPQLEQVLGRLRFTTLYLLSALGGSVLAYLVVPEVSGLGASGAIFGLFGAYFVIAKRLRGDARGIVFLLVINLMFTFVVPGISWEAHIGGLVCGAALTVAYAYAPARRRTLIHSVASVGLLVLLIALVAVQTAQLTG